MSFKDPKRWFQYLNEKHDERIVEGESYNQFHPIHYRKRKNRKKLGRLLSRLFNIR